MTLVESFEQARVPVVGTVEHIFNYTLDWDTLDYLYTECWASISASPSAYAAAEQGKLDRYMRKSLCNRARDYLRNKARSTDAHDRASVWLNGLRANSDDETDLRHYNADIVHDLIDERPYDWEALNMVCTTVTDAFKQLDAVDAFVLSQRYIECETFREIAAKMNLSRQRVHTIHERAVKRLKVLYNESIAREQP